MINIYVFFSEPLMIGKISELIKRIHKDIKLVKIIDAKQFHIDEEKQRHILITDYKNHQVLEINGVNEESFDKIIVVDDVENEEIDNLIYINKKYIITNIGTIIDDYMKEFFKRQQYTPILIKNVAENINYPIEIFVKLSEKKFVKILNANKSFTGGNLQKLILKSVTALYVKSEEYQKIEPFLFRRPEAIGEDKVSVEISAVESLHNYVEDLGFDPKVVELTKTLHNNIEEKYNHKFMKKLFSRFKGMEGSFLYNHSYLTSIIALQAGKRFTWMTPENKEKIYMGSILHDLGYLNKENSLRENLTKKQIEELPPEEQKDVLEHPTKFAKHLAQLDNIHPDVIKIIKDHHAVHGEESYPRKISNSEINLIFALFVVSHEFAIGLYKINFKEERIPILLEEIVDKFNYGNYTKVLPEFRVAIEEIFINDAAA